MKILIEPSEIKGIITAPFSKSESIRALMISLFSDNQMIINNLSDCDDVIYAKEVVRNINNSINKLNCGESALLARMLPAIASHFFDEFTIDGRGTLLNRNISKSYEIYEKMGISTQDLNFPFHFKVKNRLKDINLSDNSTSQVLTGLLIALPFQRVDSVISYNDLKSKTYIDLTFHMLENAGIKIYKKENQFQIPGNQTILNNHININSDSSAVAFLRACQIFKKELAITFIEKYYYISDYKYFNNIIVNSNTSQFELNQEIDISDNPDIFPILAIIAARNINPIKIFGISRLKYKESNRLDAILPILDAINSKYEINYESDYIQIYPAQNLTEIVKINSFSDHRLVMAVILLCFAFNIRVEISNFEAISKSYPNLLVDFKKVGAKIIELDRS